MTSNPLLVKLSSLGDVVHCFPALSDAQAHGHRFDWVVEEAFAGLAAQHPAIDRVVPFALRRWRREGVAGIRALFEFRRHLVSLGYTRVLDAQGLLKSALLSRASGAPDRYGLAADSARERHSALFYTQKSSVSWDLHAIDRLRLLFAASLGYRVDLTERPVPLHLPALTQNATQSGAAAVVLIHGTTWPSKEYPEPGWQALIGSLVADGWRVRVLSGDVAEHARARRLCEHAEAAIAVPPGQLLEACGEIASAAAVIGVDSGLTHFAAVCGRPTIGLYGPTDANRTGVRGARAIDLASQFGCAPCLQRECDYRGPLPLLAGNPVRPACFAELDTGRVLETLRALTN